MKIENCSVWKLPLALSMALVIGGCAQVGTKLMHPTAEHSPTATDNAQRSEPAQDLSLTTIVNRDLQNGRYADGERELRHYLQVHPSDRTAQSLLSQLTVEPTQMLGTPSRTHLVEANESYSTLAAQYLGDSNLFLVLARYNGATNPAVLRVGSVVHLPAAQHAAPSFSNVVSTASPPVPADNNGGQAGVTPATTGTPQQRAHGLQNQALIAYQNGKREQAIALMDQALTLDPNLKSSGSASITLRKEVVATYHQRAIVLYRDQHLDQAIALWDRVLVIDPSYEPAAVYRARAIELKQRLEKY